MIPAKIESKLLCDFDVSRETLEALDNYISTLDTWRRQINLISPDAWDDIWQRHVLDCVELFPHIGTANKILDLGSGAGFPGLILACRQKDSVSFNPDAFVHMVEATSKKVAFLRTVSRETKLNTKVFPTRIETFAIKHADTPYDLITARALASLDELLGYSQVWLLKGARALFLKGERVNEELTQAQKKWKFTYELIPNKVESTGCILSIMNFEGRIA